MTTRCGTVHDQHQCIGETGHPGPCLFNPRTITGRRITATECLESTMAYKHVDSDDCACLSCETFGAFWKGVMKDARDRLDEEIVTILKDSKPFEFKCEADEELPDLKPGAVIYSHDAVPQMYDMADPLTSPLPPIAKSADWSAKDRQIEWVRANFTPGMLAKLYKLSYDVDKLRRDNCDDLIKKG